MRRIVGAAAPVTLGDKYSGPSFEPIESVARRTRTSVFFAHEIPRVRHAYASLY